MNAWSTGLFDCCSYRDPVTDKCTWFPAFFPQAVCGACCIDGEIHTMMNNEKPICLRMSAGGMRLCCLEIPCFLFGPLGGAGLACCCGIVTRKEAIDKFNIRKDSDMTPCLATICFPCSSFQILMTLRDFKRKGIAPKSDLKTPLAQQSNM